MIIARVYTLRGEENEDRLVGLPGEPFPGDTIALKNGKVVRVLRRRYHEKTGNNDDTIDIELGVQYE